MKIMTTRALLYILVFISFIYNACDLIDYSNNRESAILYLNRTIDTSMEIPISLTKDQFNKWVNDNGVAVKEINSTIFSAKYLPPSWIILSENPNINNSMVFDSLLREYDGIYYFLFSISKNDNTRELLKNLSENNYDSYDDLVKYFSFEIQSRFKLLDNGDTLNCSFSHFERSFDTNSQLNLLIAFDKIKNKNSMHDLTLVYNDELFNVGPVKLLFPQKIVFNTPSLKLND